MNAIDSGSVPAPGAPTRRERPDVSILTWWSLIVSGLGAVCLGLSIASGGGMFNPVMSASMTIGAVAFGLALGGLLRSRRRWPGIIAIAISAALAFWAVLFVIIVLVAVRL